MSQFVSNGNLTTDQPFLYRKPSQPFDWQQYALMDLDSAINQNNIQQLQPILDSALYGDLQQALYARNIQEPWIPRVFQSQQFLLQYLFFVNDQLLKDLNNQPPNQQSELDKLRQENEQLKKALRLEQQKRQSNDMMLRLASLKPEMIEAMNRCLECGKAFADYKYLVQHYQRRHPNARIPAPPLPNYQVVEQKVVLPEPQKVMVRDIGQQSQVAPVIKEKVESPTSPRTESDIFLHDNDVTAQSPLIQPQDQVIGYSGYQQSPMNYQQNQYQPMGQVRSFNENTQSMNMQTMPRGAVLNRTGPNNAAIENISVEDVSFENQHFSVIKKSSADQAQVDEEYRKIMRQLDSK